MARLAQKHQPAPPRPYGVQREVRRNIRAWTALYGIWRGRKIKDPVQWQRAIRSESSYQLTGKAAVKLDKLVVEGLKGHRAGRTKRIRSLADLG